MCHQWALQFRAGLMVKVSFDQSLVADDQFAFLHTPVSAILFVLYSLSLYFRIRSENRV